MYLKLLNIYDLGNTFSSTCQLMMFPFCSISQLVMGTFFVAGTQYSLVLNEKKKQLPGDPVVGSQIFTAPIY